MSKLTFSAVYNETKDTILVSAHSYDGEFYKCTLDNFTSSQKPRQDLIKKSCIHYIITNIAETKYTPSTEITIPCTLYLLGEVHIEFAMQKQVEEVKDHKTAIQRILSVIRDRNPERVIEVIKLPTQFDCSDIEALMPAYHYLIESLSPSRYIDDKNYFRSTSNYEIKDMKTYSLLNAPTLDDIRIACRHSTKTCSQNLNWHNGKYDYNTRLSFDNYKTVFNTRDSDGMFMTDSGEYNTYNQISLNPKVALLIHMIAFGWRLVNIELYKYYHTLSITVSKTNSDVSIKFSVDNTHQINSINDLYPNKFTWVDSGNSTLIPQRAIEILMQFEFSKYNKFRML